MASLDRAFSLLRTLGGRRLFFRDGWGVPRTQHQSLLSCLKSNQYPICKALSISWTSVLGTPFSLGEFQSPASNFLPSASTTARVLYIPASNQNRTRNSTPIVLHLPATGDHGFSRRVCTLALWLRRQGVASLLLEGPFYGHRKPKEQSGAMLRYVYDLPALGHATIEEAAALLNHFRDLGFERQAITGISQGGLHAVMTSSMLSWPVSVIAGFAPPSAAPVFTKGVLSQFVDWKALGRDRYGENGCKQRLEQALKVSDIRNFPLAHPDAKEVLLLAKDDW